MTTESEESMVSRRVADLATAADALADWINDVPCCDPAFYRSLLNRLAP
jgi:hypothetical protein